MDAALRQYQKAHDLYLDLHGTDEVFMVQLCRLEIHALLEDAAILGTGLVTTVPAPSGLVNTDFLEAIILRNRARILQRAGHPDAAMELMQRSLAMKDVGGDYHRHTRLALARMLLDEGRPEEALQTIDRLLSDLPSGSDLPRHGEPPARAMRVEILTELGRLHQARSELEALRALRTPFPVESPPRNAIRDYQSQLE